MALTPVSLVNRALNRVGNTAFIDTLDDATTEAQVAKVEWELCLRRALADGDWKFASKRVKLLPLAGVTARTNWVNQFALPGDFIAIRGIILEGAEYPPPEVRTEFDIEANDAGNGHILLANLDTVEVRYIFYNENVGVFPAKFMEALTMLLASALAYALPKDAKLGAAFEAQYALRIAEASAADRKNQELQKLEPATPSLRARGGGGVFGTSE